MTWLKSLQQNKRGYGRSSPNVVNSFMPGGNKLFLHRLFDLWRLCLRAGGEQAVRWRWSVLSDPQTSSGISGWTLPLSCSSYILLQFLLISDLTSRQMGKGPAAHRRSARQISIHCTSVTASSSSLVLFFFFLMSASLRRHHDLRAKSSYPNEITRVSVLH